MAPLLLVGMGGVQKKVECRIWSRRWGWSVLSTCLSLFYEDSRSASLSRVNYKGVRSPSWDLFFSRAGRRVGA